MEHGSITKEKFWKRQNIQNENSKLGVYKYCYCYLCKAYRNNLGFANVI